MEDEMVRPLIFTALLASLSIPAAAQTAPRADGGSLSTIGSPTNTFGHARPSEGVVCLYNRGRKANECHSRAERQRIADRMEPARR
jgi:hypothetical protein